MRKSVAVYLAHMFRCIVWVRNVRVELTGAVAVLLMACNIGWGNVACFDAAWVVGCNSSQQQECIL